MIAVGHDVGPCVRALVDYQPKVTLSANSDMLSWTEMLKVFCEVKNLPYGGYDELDEEQIAKRFGGSPEVALEAVESLMFLEDIAECVKAGKKKLLLPEDVGLNLATNVEYLLMSLVAWC